MAISGIAVPPEDLSPAARRRGLIVILTGSFLMWGGFYMVVPLLAVEYVDHLGWSAASIGLILAVRQLVQQGLSLPGGVLADRFGPKSLLCGGFLVRAVGFGAMAWADTFTLLLASAVLAALGGSMFGAPRSAAIAALTTPANRSRFYSLAGMTSGLGMTVGPVAGAFLLRFDFSVVALVAGSFYVIAFAFTAALLPAVKVSVAQGRRLTHGLGLALRDRPFMAFTVLLMGFWFMSVQLTISLPLAAKEMTGNDNSVSWIYLLNAGMTVTLQYPLLRLAERRLQPLAILIAGMTVMSVGLATVAAADTVVVLLACVAMFSLGTLLCNPSQQTVAANYANPAALGSYFGVNELALAFGGGIGNLAGGVLHDAGQRHDLPALPWAVFATVGLLAALGLLVLHRRHAPPPPRSTPVLATGRA